jgi:mRNA-degrading endonuclease RelE of RelBE toxin-antitoxin system
MADKIVKLLAKLPPKQLLVIQSVIAQILKENFDGLDIKVMKGHKDLFRVRVGNYRIIFIIRPNDEPKILTISRRSEKTYRHF